MDEEVRTEDICQLKSDTVATATEMNKNLIDALPRLRAESGYSQTELSARTGITQAAISKIENGDVIPNLDTLNTMLASLGKTLAIVPLPGTDESLRTRYLSMVFEDSAGRKATINVYDPKINVTRSEVEEVMQDIIDGNVFLSPRGNRLAYITGVRMTTVQDL